MWLFKKKPSLLITFDVDKDGQSTYKVKFSKDVAVSHALYALDKLRRDIQASIITKGQAQGLTSKNPKTRAWQGKQKVKDVI